MSIPNFVMSSDKRGIELGFWIDEIWAQEGGTSQPFTHAEGATFTTTADLISYRLSALGNSIHVPFVGKN
jgi:hypothetical protein